MSHSIFQNMALGTRTEKGSLNITWAGECARDWISINTLSISLSRVAFPFGGEEEYAIKLNGTGHFSMLP